MKSRKKNEFVELDKLAAKSGNSIFIAKEQIYIAKGHI